MVLVAGLSAQDGQRTSRPGWPCVPGRAVDPNYLDLSESTGGLLFLFQKGEAAQSAPVMSAPYTHPTTLLRLVSNVNGSRDAGFPVDPSVESLLLLASVQCRNAVLVFRPSGSELTASNAALSIDLAAGRILRVDRPEAGEWRVRIAGTGLFVLSVLAKTDLRLTAVTFSSNRPLNAAEENSPPSRVPAFGVTQTLNFELPGPVAHLSARLVDASGGPISNLEPPERISAGVYRTSLSTPAERYRLLVSGEDSSAWPFQRMYPVLFRAQQGR